MTTSITSITPEWILATASNTYISTYTGGATDGTPPSGVPAGQLKFNTVTQQLEVFDGYSFQAINASVTLGLTQQATAVLDWARKRMEEETQIRRACETNSTVADAYAAYQEAADKLKVILSLTQENS